MSNYREINKKITLETLDLRKKDKEIFMSHIERHKDEYNFLKNYINKKDLILDIGCKDCLWFDVLVKNGLKKENLIGVDFVDKCILISKNKGYKVYNFDVVFLNNKILNYNFDIITMIHVLEHIPFNKQLNLIKNIYNMIKNNGIVFIEVPIQKTGKPEDWGHYGMFDDHNKVIDLFKNFSFDLIKNQTQPSRYIFKKVKI